MHSNDRSLTIEELAEQAQTSVRTVRYYITENLLPGPGSRGKGAAYTEEHLQRLRLIRRLSERRAPLAEIREVMARVTDDEVRALLAEEDARAQTLDATQAVSPKAYIAALLDQARGPQTPPRKPRPAYAPPTAAFRPPPPTTPTTSAGGATQASAWRRVELAPGVELHIEEEAVQRYRSFIERLLQTPRDEP